MAGKKFIFFAIVFSICIHKQNQCTQCKFPCIQMTHCRPGTTRNTFDVMCGINLIFAIISNFALYFSIVRLQLIFFAINSRLRGTNFIRTTYSELIRFSFLEVWTVNLRWQPIPCRTVMIVQLVVVQHGVQNRLLSLQHPFHPHSTLRVISVQLKLAHHLPTRGGYSAPLPQPTPPPPNDKMTIGKFSLAETLMLGPSSARHRTMHCRGCAHS